MVEAGGAPEDSDLAGKSGQEALDAIHFKLPLPRFAGIDHIVLDKDIIGTVE